jgi:hypothetical protein
MNDSSKLQMVAPRRIECRAPPPRPRRSRQLPMAALRAPQPALSSQRPRHLLVYAARARASRRRAPRAAARRTVSFAAVLRVCRGGERMRACVRPAVRAPAHARISNAQNAVVRPLRRTRHEGVCRFTQFTARVTTLAPPVAQLGDSAEVHQRTHALLRKADRHSVRRTGRLMHALSAVCAVLGRALSAM